MDDAKFLVIDRYAKREKSDVFQDVVVCCARTLEAAQDKIPELIGTGRVCAYPDPSGSVGIIRKLMIVEIHTKMYFEEWPENAKGGEEPE